MDLDPAVCERARLSRDARFDGRFFIAVKTTGVYCRPVCPVRPPKARNVRFMRSAAAASEAGFRPCLRCRPEASPGTPAWLGTSASVSRALRLIGDGALDSGSVDALAQRLGIGARHLNRLFLQHLGASPVAVAQTRRLHFAKKLLDETDLSMAQVAMSSGFGSVRRFNAVLRSTYQRSPSELRALAAKLHGSGVATSLTGEGFQVRLPYRPPFDWDAIIGFLSLRAIPGVERVDAAAYRRSVSIGGVSGIVEVRPVPGESCLALCVRLADSRCLLPIAERVRRIFDLGADPQEIAGHLAGDPLLAPLVEAHPGLRVPGAFDVFELAVRAVLGQQVSVRGATTLAGRLVESFGEPLAGARADDPQWLFPTAVALADADLSCIGLTRSRAATIRGLAQAVHSGELSLDDTGADLETGVERLTRLSGIGPWTAQYVAMRAWGEPDAFPTADLVLARAAAPKGAEPLRARALSERAEAWRPWRAYAALHLWTGGAAETSARSTPSAAKTRRAPNSPTRSQSKAAQHSLARVAAGVACEGTVQ